MKFWYTSTLANKGLSSHTELRATLFRTVVLLRGDDKEDLFLKLINKDSFTAFVDDDLVKKRSKVYLGVEHSEANVNLGDDEAQILKVFLKDRGIVPDTYGLKIAILDT